MVSDTARASAILDLALADPARALERATELLDEAAATGAKAPAPTAGTVIATRARGLAKRLLGDLNGSLDDLERGAELAHEVGEAHLQVGVAITMAGTLVLHGKVHEAKEKLNAALEIATGLERAEAMFQLGTTHAQAGELDRALAVYKKALPLIRRHGRTDWEAQLIGNRGVISIHTGDYSRAERDLSTVIAMQIDTGSPAQAAINMHNLAQALYMQGRMAESLDTYERAEQMQGDLGLPVMMHAQKCEAYLAAGMFEDTMAHARKAFDFHRDAGTAMGAILSLMPGAEAALALEDHALAQRMAHEASRISGDQFPAWAARADLLAIEAKRHSNTAAQADVDRAVALFDAVRGSDSVTAARALLLGSRLALALDDIDAARDLVDRAGAVVRRCPLHVQIERWHLVAAIRQRTGNRTGSARAVQAGLRAFDRLVGGLTAYDVRARSQRHVEALVDIGAAGYLEAGRIPQTAALIERARGSALRIGQRTDDDAQALIGAETAMRRGASKSTAVRDLQQALGDPSTEPPAPASLRHDEIALTCVDIEDRLVVLIERLSPAGRSTTTTLECGPLDEIRTLVDEQALAHRQLARRQRLSRSASAALDERVASLDQALASRLLPDSLAARVLVNPSPSLAGLVWAALAPLAEREHTLVFDKAMARRPLPRSVRKTAVLGSSDLAHVADEIDGIAEVHGTSPILDPDELPPALLNVDVLHAAGHFVAHGENPLFSELPLGSTRLRGSELASLQRPPKIAVLSACTTGGGESIGGTPMGVATALLAAGTAAVIVTHAPIEDGTAVVATMRRLHEELAAGRSPAEALLVARREATDAERPVAAAFHVLGAGWR